MTVEPVVQATARSRVNRIRAHVVMAWADIVESWRERDWIALGYESWDAMCEAEFGGARIALPLHVRQETVAQLHGEGMSTRAIASAVGVSQPTIVRDVKAATDSNESVETVMSLDGRQRPASIPTVAPQGPTVDELLERDADVIAARRRHELAKYLAAMAKPLDDPIEMARIAPDMFADVESSIDRLSKWADRFRAAMPKPAPVLQMVKES